MKSSLKPRVTIRTVADEAGVSPATVSLILAERPGWIEQFHPDTIRKVRHAARRLGYRRNMFASAMPQGASNFFALVLHEMCGASDETWHHWAFEGALLEGVNAVAEPRGVHAIVVTTRLRPGDSDAGKVTAVIEGGVFGAIVRTPGAALESVLRARLARGHPIVVVFPRATSGWSTNAIDVDNVAAGQAAGRLLGRRRRSHWLLVRYQQANEVHRHRADGVTMAARQAGARLSTVRLPLGMDEHESAAILVRHLESSSVDGVFAIDSISSVGAVLACAGAGRRAGEACDVVGCDASMWRTPGLPRITSVDISWREVGELAMERLLECRPPASPRFKTILLAPRIVEGESCPVRRGARG
jgi:DNA-binding LacI/PurR family transcriptional regulator